MNSGPPCSPDYWHSCSPLTITGQPWYGVPANGVGFQQARSGEAYAGFYAYSANVNNGREFIQVELSQPIVAGVKYEVSFHVSLADKFLYAVSTLGAHFSETLIVRDSYMIWDLNLTPQVSSPPDVLLDDKENWIEVRDTFSSRYGGERFLVIGNFNLDGESGVELLETGNQSYIHAYYYIDDVSVIALDSLPNSVAEPEQGQRGFAVYPNPNNGEMTLRYALPDKGEGILEIIDMVGRRVMTRSLPDGIGTMGLSVGDASSGLYTIVIRSQGRPLFTERVSIMKQ